MSRSGCQADAKFSIGKDSEACTLRERLRGHISGRLDPGCVLLQSLFSVVSLRKSPRRLRMKIPSTEFSLASRTARG